MKLVGMLDSPFVRRTAICLDILGLDFEHQALSVFRDYEAFSDINPVVKAPTLVCDDGGIIMESGAIIHYAQILRGNTNALYPPEKSAQQTVQSIIGLALAACEKTVHIVYETQKRPQEKQHQAWIDRVHSQLNAAYCQLERHYAADIITDPALTLEHISTAVAWRFTHIIAPNTVDNGTYPALAALSRIMEDKAVFKKYPPSEASQIPQKTQ